MDAIQVRVEPLQGFEVTEIGLLPLNGLDTSEGQDRYAEWYEAGVSLGNAEARISTILAWCWGDWILFGDSSYGTTYIDAVELSGKSQSTLENYAWVSRYTPHEMRGLEGLTFRHYLETMKVKNDPTDRLAWLKLASEERWSAADLNAKLVYQIKNPEGEMDEVIPPVNPLLDAQDQLHELEVAQRKTLAGIAEQQKVILLISQHVSNAVKKLRRMYTIAADGMFISPDSIMEVVLLLEPPKEKDDETNEV